MADTKISALPAASTPLTGSEVVPLNQSGVTSNVTVANLTAGRNVYANNFIPSVTTTAASATPINLTVNSTQYQIVNGTTTSQQFNLPDATTLSVGDTYYFNNNLTVSSVQVNAHDGSTSVLSLQAGGDAQVVLLNNSTTNGTWDAHSFIPSSASWGTATLSFNNTTSISGSVSWTGTKIGTAYGGTGLTSFTSNGVVYASSTSALATSSAFTFNGTDVGFTGNLIPGTAGKGINFSASTGPGTNKLLSDYEEGTYTITLTPSTSGSFTLNYALGAYTKVGRIVTVQAQIQVGSSSSPVGTSVTMSLPIAIGNTLSGIANRFGGMMTTSNNGNFKFTGVGGDSLVTCDINASTVVTGSGGNGNWYFSFTYISA